MKRYDRAYRSPVLRCGSDDLLSRKIEIDCAAHRAAPVFSGGWTVRDTPNWAHLSSISCRGRRNREAREASGSPDLAKLFRTTRSPCDQLRGGRDCVTMIPVCRRLWCQAFPLPDEQMLKRSGRASRPPTRPGADWRRGRLSHRGNTLRGRGGQDVRRV